MGDLKALIGQLDKLTTKLPLEQHFPEFKKSIDNYKSLSTIGKYNTLGTMEAGMANAINKKYGTSTEQGGMNNEQRYNFYLAVSNNLKKLVIVLNHVKSITEDEGGEVKVTWITLLEVIG